MSRLILASASPRRREILAQAGLQFDVLPAHIDETERAGEAPDAYVKRLAEEKAAAVLRIEPSAVILAADTTVELDGRILGKPRDVAEAAEMLHALSGHTHHVHTGVCVLK